jgi:cytochrome b
MTTTLATPSTRIPVWDWPVRVFHILLAISFAGAWLTAESETWRLVHITLGYTMAGLIGFRVLWGLVGTRYARFASFVRGPAAVQRYLKSLVGRTPEHSVGHNPAGAWAIVLLLSLGAATAATGWAGYNELAGEWLNEVHEALATGMLTVVGVHILGVVVSSWLHRENLARAMLTGQKRGNADQASPKTWPALAVALLVVVLGFWAWQWRTAPAPGDAATAQAIAGQHKHEHGHGHDHDD